MLENGAEIPKDPQENGQLLIMAAKIHQNMNVLRIILQHGAVPPKRFEGYKDVGTLIHKLDWYGKFLRKKEEKETHVRYIYDDDENEIENEFGDDEKGE